MKTPYPKLAGMNEPGMAPAPVPKKAWARKRPPGLFILNDTRFLKISRIAIAGLTMPILESALA
jgi:hypothetical protein